MQREKRLKKPGNLWQRATNWFYFLGDQELISHPKAKMQKYFALQALFGGFGMTFMGGMFLMAVYKKIGMDDNLIAYATSVFPTLVTGLIFFVSSLITGVKKIKAAAVLFNALHKMTLFSVVLVPLVMPESWQMYGAIGLYMLSTLINGANTIFINTLYVKTIPNSIRGRSVAVRSNLGLIVGLVLPIIGTLLLDSFPDNYTVLLSLYTFSGTFAVFECWSLYKVDEVPQEEAEIAKSPRFRDTFVTPLSNKAFLKYAFSVNFIVYLINFAASFGTVYLLNVLGYSYSYIQIVSMLCSVVQLVSYKWAGRLTDRYNPRFIYYFGFIIYAVDAIVKGFTSGGVLKFILPFSNVMLGAIVPFYAVGTYKRKYELVHNNFGIYDAFSSMTVALMYLTIPMLAPRVMEAAAPFTDAFGLHGYQVLYILTGVLLFVILSGLIIRDMRRKPEGFMDNEVESAEMKTE